VYLLESSVIKQFVFCNAKLDLYKIITSSQYIIITKNDRVHNQMTETQVQKQIDKQNMSRPIDLTFSFCIFVFRGQT
jgi:hypothetical protein